MQLEKHLMMMLLMLLAAALTASGAGLAAAQEFVAVPAVKDCTASTVTVDARSDIECAVKSSQVNPSLSFSFINGGCVLSDDSNCAAPDAATLLRRKIDAPGYEKQVGGRRFWVFQQRQTGMVAFNRTWAEYEMGFGDATEFWSGLLQIRSFIRSHDNCTLRIEMTTLNGTLYVSEWQNFTVADSSTQYTMNCGSYISSSSNSSGDSMTVHRGMKFSAMDRDNDKVAYSCSTTYGGGGFWFNSCYDINPNGAYPPLQFGINSNPYICSHYVEDWVILRGIRMMLQM